MGLTIYDVSDYKVKHTLEYIPCRDRYNLSFDEYNGGGLDRYSIFQYNKVLSGLSALEMVSRDYGRLNFDQLKSDNDWYRVYIIYRQYRYDNDCGYDDINEPHICFIQSMIEEETGFYLTLEYNDICYFNCHEDNLSFKVIIDYLKETFSMVFNSDFAMYVEKIDNDKHY